MKKYGRYAISLLLIGLVLLGFGLYNQIAADRLQTQTVAEVTERNITEKGDGVRHYRYRYEYVVDGKTYSFFAESETAEEWSGLQTRRIILYDAANPGWWVYKEDRLDPNDGIAFIIGGCFTTNLSLFFWLAILNDWRKRWMYRPVKAKTPKVRRPKVPKEKRRRNDDDDDGFFANDETFLK